MAVIVSGQKPAILEPLHTTSFTGDLDLEARFQDVVMKPLLTPFNPVNPVVVDDGTGKDVTSDIPSLLWRRLSQAMDPDEEDEAKSFLGQTMIHFDQSAGLPVVELFAIQAGTRRRMVLPQPGKIVYAAGPDVIPAAKALLASAGVPGDDDEFFASLAYAYHPETLGAWFRSEDDFLAFAEWIKSQAASMTALLPADTINKMNQVAGLTLKGLTESLLLRKDDMDAVEEFSFPRVIVSLLMTYIESSHKTNSGVAAGSTGLLPFHAGELLHPKSVVLVNVEAHARSTADKVTSEWDLINRSLASPVRVIPLGKLAKLTAFARIAKRLSRGPINKPGQPGSRSGRVVFRKKAPKTTDIYKDIMRALRRMKRVNQSLNVYRSVKPTFAKANRRDPDDFNKPGKTISTRYLPDIHVYVDTSGSISEENYQGAVQMLIALAKKLNVNLYFNSFCHFMSGEALLRVENKSPARIWQEFRRIPKVEGGTDFKQVWDYIMASKKRQRQFSLMITDFEWYPPSTRTDYPPNLYYAPCSGFDWDCIVSEAKDFAKAMRHIDPGINQHLLGMIK